MPIPEPAEGPKHAAVTIRHTRHALQLLIQGALREIELRYGDTKECDEWVVELFDGLTEQLQTWEIDTAWVTRAEFLVKHLQVTGPSRSPEVQRYVLELLAEYDMIIP